MDAWRLIHAWRLARSTVSFINATEDCEAFLGWARIVSSAVARAPIGWIRRVYPTSLGSRAPWRNRKAGGGLLFRIRRDRSFPSGEFLAEINAVPHEPPLQRTVTPYASLRLRRSRRSGAPRRGRAAYLRQYPACPRRRRGPESFAVALRKWNGSFREELQPGSAPDAESGISRLASAGRSATTR